MKKKGFYIRVVIALLFFSTTISSQEIKVKNVVLMIGDGMGISQLYAAIAKSTTPLNMERCPVVGLMKTHASDNYVTDSGAAGTAIACGIKTKTGMVGMSPDSIPQESILEKFHKLGLSTGVVVTSNVTHATPAAFVAHQVNREMTEEIAADYVKSDIDLFIGGGRNDFEKRKDNKNLSEELFNKGYQLVYSMSEIPKIKSGKLAALVADNHPPKVEMRGSMLYDGTTKALELLGQNDKGFFLMIEGSQIDWAAHENNIDDLIDEINDFDAVVGLVLDFAEKEGNTLVIVTADHETGGLILLNKDKESGEIVVKFTTIDHSASPVPVFSFGPGSELFTGLFENTLLSKKILELY